MVEDTRTHNIVVCCDGSWCGAETGTRSNIQIIADAFASQGQSSYVHATDGKRTHNDYTNTDVCYFNGAGLDGFEDLQKKYKDLPSLSLVGGFADTLLYISNGAIAKDLPMRCKEAYSFISKWYQGPDQSRIWLFGLSRGAYTVRAVAGMINNCGIVRYQNKDDAALKNAVEAAYSIYSSEKEEDSPGDEGTAAKEFRDNNSWARGSLPPIIFMGLLDTVGATGIPRVDFDAPPADITTYNYQFYDVNVSSEVQHVFQAASTHDRFAPFEPCPVRRNVKHAAAMAGLGGDYTGHYPGVEFTMREVWFPGAHYDLGRQDFVLGNHPLINRVNRGLNPLRSNVSCTPELSDYPLLGHALPGHTSGGPGSNSGSSSGNGSSSELCLVAQVNKFNPGMLPPADDDKTWSDLVDGYFVGNTANGIINRLLLPPLDLGLQMLRPGFWLAQQISAGVPLLPDAWRPFQLPYTIDAEDIALGPVVDKVAVILNTRPEMLLKDRIIPLPPSDDYGSVGEAEFFPVPRDNGSFDSYKSQGRDPGWFRSNTYNTYTTGLGQLAGDLEDRLAGSSQSADVAEPAVTAPQVPDAVPVAEMDRPLKSFGSTVPSKAEALKK